VRWTILRYSPDLKASLLDLIRYLREQGLEGFDPETSEQRVRSRSQRSGAWLKMPVGASLLGTANTAGELCESAKLMKLQLDAQLNRFRICCSLITA
jgi:hypothetical protein